MAFDHKHVLELIRQQAGALIARLRSLGEADWDKPTACTDWNVADLVAHLSSGVLVQRMSLERGLQGETSPPIDYPSGRAELTATKRAMPSSRKADDYDQGMRELLDLFGRLEPADLDKQAWHQSGVRPIRWFFTQRLGETTFHAGDIYFGLGEPFAIPRDVADVLLPAYLARLERLFQPGQPGGLRATIAFQNAGALRIAGGRAEYSEHAQPPDADLTLRAAAETLVLIATGRLHPRDAVAAGSLDVEGDRSLVDRWREVFRPL